MLDMQRLSDKASVRWSVMTIVSFTMMCGYILTDIMAPMKEVLETENEQEKQKVLEKSKSLIDLIIKENIPITFFGQSIESQNAELIKMQAVPVSEWNYKW